MKFNKGIGTARGSRSSLKRPLLPSYHDMLRVLSYNIVSASPAARGARQRHNVRFEMDKRERSAPKIAEIAGRIVALLEPLSSEDRRKAIDGSLVLLGESSIGQKEKAGDGATAKPETEGGKRDFALEGVHARAATWMKQQGLTFDKIEQVFDVTKDGVTVISSEAPGKDNKEKTRNSYVLYGVSRFLGSGETTFDDKAARAICEEFGCYDSANHATYMKDRGNILSGSKSTGWKLTAPGLKHGADLVKQLTTEE